MEPEEAEFFGETQLVSIVPKFSSGKITLISGDFGPFLITIPVTVPLWLAVNLKLQHKCKIIPPDWMDVETLDSIKNNEKNSKLFIKMPCEYYIIVAKLLLECASENIPNSDEVRTMIKDIYDMRMAKLRSSVDELIRTNGSYASIDNLTTMELNSVRVILSSGMEQIHRMKNKPALQDDQSRTFLFAPQSRTPSSLQSM